MRILIETIHESNAWQTLIPCLVYKRKWEERKIKERKVDEKKENRKCDDFLIVWFKRK